MSCDSCLACISVSKEENDLGVSDLNDKASFGQLDPR